MSPNWLTLREIGSGSGALRIDPVPPISLLPSFSSPSPPQRGPSSRNASSRRRSRRPCRAQGSAHHNGGSVHGPRSAAEGRSAGRRVPGPRHRGTGRRWSSDRNTQSLPAARAEPRRPIRRSPLPGSRLPVAQADVDPAVPQSADLHVDFAVVDFVQLGCEIRARLLHYLVYPALSGT